MNSKARPAPAHMDLVTAHAWLAVVGLSDAEVDALERRIRGLLAGVRG